MTTGQNTTVNIANNTTVDHSSDISDVPSTSFSNQYTPTLESELVTPLHCPSDDLGDSFLANLLPINSTSCPNTNGSDIENVLVGTDQHITLNMNDSEEEGYGAEPEENPYLFRRSGQKTFSKNLAKETTYKVKFNDTWKGKKLRNLKKELEKMFDDVLNKAKGNDNDLGRVIISHPELNNSIVVPLDKRSNINSQRVMEAVENVLNSEENLPLDTSMHVTIGNITVPRGSGRFPIIRLKGTSNSLALKKPILQVCNEDKMCLATAIGRCFLKLCKIVPLEKWRETTKNDEDMNTFQKVIKHGMTTKRYFKHVSASALKNTSYSKTMAITLCKEANLSTDEALSIRDIEHFENVLDVNILVLSARLGNKFCRVSTKSTG
ncbi:unnamed protein product [Mytilus edulis]|uniref:Uncharacterized protein n=1 Tax=Mytilus edulis TaxID=6550 RepID=A0A8S3ULT1_MYTED|nr:unnamed protein product [Mytilus edulis]